jgi:ribosome-associated protein
MNIVRNSRSLPEDVRDRLVRLAGKPMTRKGELIIEARRFRTQEQNRQDARSRLIELLRKAAEPVSCTYPHPPGSRQIEGCA